MTILSLTAGEAGQVGEFPRRVKILCTDDFSAVTTAGFITQTSIAPQVIYGTDFVDVAYSYDPISDISINGEFTVVIGTAGVITLVPYVGSAEVTATGTVSAGLIAIFNSSTYQLSVATGGQIGSNGPIASGKNGTLGGFIVFPGAGSAGSLQLTCTANSVNQRMTLTNASCGQATTWSLPDPGQATANVVLSRIGAGYLQTGVTGTYGGGGTSNAFTVTGLTASSVVVASIKTSTTAVAIAKAVASTDTLTVTFSADPGAGTTVSYIASSTSL